jgi:hypothetical protein
MYQILFFRENSQRLIPHNNRNKNPRGVCKNSQQVSADQSHSEHQYFICVFINVFQRQISEKEKTQTPKMNP